MNFQCSADKNVIFHITSVEKKEACPQQLDSTSTLLLWINLAISNETDLLNESTWFCGFLCSHASREFVTECIILTDKLFLGCFLLYFSSKLRNLQERNMLGALSCSLKIFKLDG